MASIWKEQLCISHLSQKLVVIKLSKEVMS